MSRSLAEILDEQDDARLCGDLAAFLFPPSVKRRNLRSLPRPQRVIRLVWESTTQVESGGFRELLTQGVPGDRGLALTTRAFEIVGCRLAAQVFRDAVARFPGSTLPRERADRVSVLDSQPSEFAELVQRFHAVYPDVVHSLAAYVRSHRSDLLTGTKASRTRSRGTPADLPHWARVLFAARCAKLVYPLLRIHWPNMIGPRKVAIKRAIHVAAKSAISGQPHEGAEEAVAQAEHAAGAAHGGRTPLEIEPRASSGISRTIASFVAKASEKAALSARLPPAESIPAVDDCFRFAQSAAVAAGSSVMMRKLKRAFSRLHAAAHSGKWTDTTAVERRYWENL